MSWWWNGVVEMEIETPGKEVLPKLSLTTLECAVLHQTLPDQFEVLVRLEALPVYRVSKPLV